MNIMGISFYFVVSHLLPPCLTCWMVPNILVAFEHFEGGQLLDTEQKAAYSFLLGKAGTS